MKKKRNGKTWYELRVQIGVDQNKKPKMKYFTGKTPKEAKQKYKAYQYQQEDELNATTGCADIETYFTWWLENVKFQQLKPTSYDRLEMEVKNHIIPVIGDCIINEIQGHEIQTKCINAVAAKLSYSTVKKVYDALNACFKYALDNRVIKYNPMTTVVKPTRNQISAKTKTIEILTEDEIKLIECEVAKTYKTGKPIHTYGYAIILALNTGVRIGELLALKWQCIDFCNKQMDVQNNIVLVKNRDDKSETNFIRIEQNSTKTAKGNRVIPLNNKALNALEHLKRLNDSTIENNYIVSVKGLSPTSLRNIQRSLDGILAACKIKHKGTHSLRHDYVKLKLKNLQTFFRHILRHEFRRRKKGVFICRCASI